MGSRGERGLSADGRDLTTALGSEGFGDLAESDELLRRALGPISRKLCDPARLVPIEKVQGAFAFVVTTRSPLRGFHDLPLPSGPITKSDLTHVAARG